MVQMLPPAPLQVVHLAAARLLQQDAQLPWPISVFFGDLPIRDARDPSADGEGYAYGLLIFNAFVYIYSI